MVDEYGKCTVKSLETLRNVKFMVWGCSLFRHDSNIVN